MNEKYTKRAIGNAFAVLSTKNGKVVGRYPTEITDLARKMLKTGRKLMMLERYGA